MESNELPIEDLNLIAHIDARLKKLEQFMADVIGTPIAPVDTKEGFGFCVKAEFSQVVKCSTQCEYCEQRERNLSQQGEQPNQIKEEVKERFEVEVYQPFIRGDDGFKIHISPTFKMRKLMAHEIADKIKALLATL